MWLFVMAHSGNATDRPGSAASGSTSTSLLERVKARDAEAWRRLVKLYGPLVYRWCRQSGRGAEEADDIVQEVFSAVAQHVGTFRHEQPSDSFRAWLATITRHKISDSLRRRHGEAPAQGGTAAQQRLLQLPELSCPSTDQPGDDDTPWHRSLELVRAEFEDRTWRAFWRVVVDGQTPADVADEFGLTIHAVYKAKSRVLRRVRQELGGLEDA
jgi:RNA polymerase sigma-70 factor, ECF subfamily